MSEYIGQNVYIKPNYIVSVPEYDSPKNLFSNARVKNEANLKKNKHNSILSDKAKKRICNAINWLVVSAKSKSVYHKHSGKRFNFKVNLITLTIPDTQERVSESFFKTKLIHPWIVYMKKYHNLRNYVWKIEFHKSGKLHVHITSDTYIDAYIIRHHWNRILDSNGLMSDFFKKFKHKNPNSTDVHAVWKVENLAAYLAKYLSKNEQNTETVTGRIWSCNYELSDKRKCHVFIDRHEAHLEMKSLMHKQIKWKELIGKNKKTGLPIRIAELFFITEQNWKEHITGKIKAAYNKHRFKIRNHAIFDFELPQPVILKPVEVITQILKPVQQKLEDILYEAHVYQQRDRGQLLYVNSSQLVMH